MSGAWWPRALRFVSRAGGCGGLGGFLHTLLTAMCLFIFQNQETREILHFHYTTWPDFGVPESPASFLNFLFKVRESGSLSPEHGPIVVHCSAGIGRSGTFCLADTCLLLVRRSWKAPSPPQPGHSSWPQLPATVCEGRLAL